jgi:hypothetical protein
MSAQDLKKKEGFAKIDRTQRVGRIKSRFVITEQDVVITGFSAPEM